MLYSTITITLFLCLPLIVSGILHMAAVRLDFLKPIAVPIHTKIFGPNKTWRGFILMPLFTVLGCLIYYCLQDLTDLSPDFKILRSQILSLGSLLGLAYTAAELPNSFIKRKLAIPAGSRSEKFPYFFILIDQIDSAIGCLIVYAFYFKLSPFLVISIILISPALHLFINGLLFACKLRRSPF